LSVSKVYSVQNTREVRNKIVLADLELTQQQDRSYCVHVIGKNGEVHPSADVEICAKHKFLNHEIKTILRSDEAGMINLGKLEGFTQVIATLQEKLQTAQPASKTWPVNQNELYGSA